MMVFFPYVILSCDGDTKLYVLEVKEDYCLFMTLAKRMHGKLGELKNLCRGISDMKKAFRFVCRLLPELSSDCTSNISVFT